MQALLVSYLHQLTELLVNAPYLLMVYISGRREADTSVLSQAIMTLAHLLPPNVLIHPSLEVRDSARSYSSILQNFRSQLETIVKQLLLHRQWEIRDSALSLLHILSTTILHDSVGRKAMELFSFFSESIFAWVLKRMGDSQPYVIVSSLKLISLLLETREGWDHFLSLSTYAASQIKANSFSVNGESEEDLPSEVLSCMTTSGYIILLHQPLTPEVGAKLVK